MLESVWVTALSVPKLLLWLQRKALRTIAKPADLRIFLSDRPVITQASFVDPKLAMQIHFLKKCADVRFARNLTDATAIQLKPFTNLLCSQFFSFSDPKQHHETT